MIVDGRGRPLPSEFLPDEKTFQPHYQVIDAENQVQIYEELTLNGKKEFSTSFIHRDSHPKDNRLLARGWLSGNHLATKSPIVKQFLVATDPEGISVLQDPDFGDNGGQGASGIDHIRYVISLPSGVHKEDVAVTATMYYQSIPPYFLAQRFKIAPKGEATRRLYYLTSRLTTKESYTLAELRPRPRAGDDQSRRARNTSASSRCIFPWMPSRKRSPRSWRRSSKRGWSFTAAA